MNPRVVVLSLSSDFGCQVQMTNFPELLDLLGTIDLSYWQLATSGHMPDEFDVAIIEGAVTTDEQVELIESVRKIAGTVIAIGACALTGGVPGLALNGDLEEDLCSVYGADSNLIAAGHRRPQPVDSYIEVDFRVPGCPINPEELSILLQRALRNLFDRPMREPVCAECKVAENPCFYAMGKMCLGLVTRGGCAAKCVSRGRPCTGCRGIAIDANVESARAYIAKLDYDIAAFDKALDLYSSARKERS